MAIPLPLSLKLKLPFYRARWLRRYAAMLAELARLDARATYGGDAAEPWVELRDGPRLHGHRTGASEAEIFTLLAPALPRRLPVSHFQLMRSCVNLHVYPHMRPDLKPAGFGQDQMHGFQATHRDAIADLPDPQLRASLLDVFHPKPDDVILDCGAFLGFGDIAVAPFVPHGRVVAIEAKAANHALQRKNLEWNRIANVTPIHRGVWCDTREIDLQTSHAHANTLVAEVHTGDDVERVRTTGIDELVAELNLPKVDMISLTLNGAEVEALEGAQDTLRRHKPRIRAAGWYRRDGRLIADLCRERLEPHGYRVIIGARGNVLAVAR